jgi:hypothetical protein
MTFLVFRLNLPWLNSSLTFFRSNALIKRASLHIQQCSDPEKDTLLSFADFEEALKADPTNPDIFFHRGQVLFLISFYIKKLCFAVAQVYHQIKVGKSWVT